MNETEALVTIKHLVMLLEESREEIKKLQREIEDLRTYIWNREHPAKTEDLTEIIQKVFDLPKPDPMTCTTGKSACDGGITLTTPLGTDRVADWESIGHIYKRKG